MAINIFHHCLVIFQPFASTCRFLAGLFTFLSRQAVYLSTSSELVEGTGLELPSELLKKKCNIMVSAKCGRSYMQMNSRKLVM